MDFIKKASGSGSGNTQQQTGGALSRTTVTRMGKKANLSTTAANMLDKKYNNGRLGEAKLEKITDGLRTGYEKATGNKVNSKISN
ncbi:hypothetical protein PG997_002499 [Apiospora hydei]|uniref:Uncharacterized protein n=1 Tax=Apiospora hydei TaxID=1337664 RepID=A0ABR1WWN0_9PEZI